MATQPLLAEGLLPRLERTTLTLSHLRRAQQERNELLVAVWLLDLASLPHALYVVGAQASVSFSSAVHCLPTDPINFAFGTSDLLNARSICWTCVRNGVLQNQVFREVACEDEGGLEHLECLQ